MISGHLTYKKIIPPILNHLVCGVFLWQYHKTNMNFAISVKIKNSASIIIYLHYLSKQLQKATISIFTGRILGHNTAPKKTHLKLTVLCLVSWNSIHILQTEQHSEFVQLWSFLYFHPVTLYPSALYHVELPENLERIWKATKFLERFTSQWRPLCLTSYPVNHIGFYLQTISIHQSRS